MSKVYVIHENAEWVAPLATALDKRSVDWQDWFVDGAAFSLAGAPPRGIFYNRMSASAHTRGHRFAPEATLAILRWLELHGRTVFNGSNALQLEISKVAQYSALAAQGIATPETIITSGADELRRAAKQFGRWPFILKPNRGGKGLGVKLISSAIELEDFIESGALNDSLDGIWLLQEYIESPERRITRCEFVDGRFLYAVSVDASNGFELCPADACEVPEAADSTVEKFIILQDFHEPALISAYQRLLLQQQVATAGIEFISDGHGNHYTYDINTNTNYNAGAEARVSGITRGMDAIAEMLATAQNAIVKRAVA